MNEVNFHRDNYYVSQAYLKKWGSSSNQIWAYRTLVSHKNVPLWKESFIKGIAYHSCLYTRITSGVESDEIETWLDTEYEAPAEEVFQKVASEARLTPSDWRILVRFLAAQDLRTPACLTENLKCWRKILPKILENTLHKSIRKLELIRSGETDLQQNKSSMANNLPFRVKTKIVSDKKFGILKAETVIGRGMWLYGIRHLLTQTSDILHQHRWTILSPPKGMQWFTSDDPVIRLNFHDHDKYDFRGGWGSVGTEIFLPVTPEHLLYTQAGKRSPRRGTKVTPDIAQIINRFIAEHAHRMIFASEPDINVSKYRPRVVGSEYFRDEKAQWTKWHVNQMNAERELMGWT